MAPPRLVKKTKKDKKIVRRAAPGDDRTDLIAEEERGEEVVDERLPDSQGSEDLEVERVIAEMVEVVSFVSLCQDYLS